jgi:BirA family biotin operon repressor/biotin-[acetyl-CoA-carboxylase] ligase
LRGRPLAGGRFRLQRHAQVGSTNALARDHAASGEPEGLIVLAAHQTAGRGRHGRGWASPEGNLYASVVLRPACPLGTAATLSLVTALSVVEALDPMLGDPGRLAVKWPNDVLLDGAKLGGILLEGEDDGRGGCAWLVVGLGLNLASSPGPGETPYATANLRDVAGVDLTPDAFLDRWLPALAARLDTWRSDGFRALRPAWLARAAGVGLEVSLRLGERSVVRGRFADLGEDGTLVLETAPGHMVSHSAGELFFG